ncbi:phosphomannomutase 45a [Anaeramoeba flamelloides]|uniref:Phosphomannomutase 45a n=1 Tax=Anaeramoeba flamelloides TaxID=1746091 RepID=A0ABQ8YFM3_9EUKA|nr:phosphomannomutase 45a [Anaeramoeba flamelloides]
MSKIIEFIKKHKVSTTVGAVIAVTVGGIAYKSYSNYQKSVYFQANQWLKIDTNKETRQEVEKLIKGKKQEQLQELFDKRLEFGTAGLRAKMGAGYSRMNHITVQQTAQGWAEYLLEVFDPETVQKKGIVIGYDHRDHSKEFAEITANVFMLKGFKVYLFNCIVPTPLLSYAVRILGTAGGVMVTPSHNPKEYNGYKVYWENSVQIIPPHDKGISQKILENLELLDLEKASELSSELLYDPIETNQVDEQYYNEIYEELKSHLCYNLQSSSYLKITYTAMHGVGYEWIKRAIKTFEFNPIIPVESQVEPDPKFPTVPFPNPEEKGALDLAMETADLNGSSLIIANDPDADRLAVAEKIPSSQFSENESNKPKWHVFHGNEIGILLAWWQFKKYQRKSSKKPIAILNSTVSSKMVKALADKFGFKYEETLTGFKWLGNKAIDLEKQGYKVLLAFEEAIGYMVGSTVYDKDGISAAMALIQMALYLEDHNSTLLQQFEKLSIQKLGYFLFNNSYFYCYDKEVINSIFKKIRNDGKYFEKLGPFKIKSIRDLTTGYDSSKKDNKAVLYVDPNSQMITFTFENDATITLRTSGTEPKIKYYIELSEKLSKETVREKLDKLTQMFIETYLEPEKNELVPPKQK